MPDESAFLNMILDAPDHDGPRLVFADWLEETGQCARAAFIRDQVLLASLAPRDPRRQALECSTTANLALNQNEWFPELPNVVPDSQYAIRRGFVDMIRARLDDALVHGNDWVSRWPITELRLDGVRKRQFSQLLEQPFLQKLQTLSMYRADTGASGAGALAQCRYLSRLQRLLIGENHIGDQGLASLARAPMLRALVELDVRHNSIGNDGLRYLAQHANFPELRSLNLCGNHQDIQAVIRLLESDSLPQLSEVSLWFTQLGDGDLSALAGSPGLSRLRSLSLNNNPISEIGLRILASSPYAENLESLWLAYNRISARAARSLLESPYLRNLTELNLHGSSSFKGVELESLRQEFGDRISVREPP